MVYNILIYFISIHYIIDDRTNKAKQLPKEVHYRDGDILKEYSTYKFIKKINYIKPYCLN